jgi:hypothetical protein
MFSGQENTETPVVNKIVYNLVALKWIILIFPLTQCSLGFARRCLGNEVNRAADLEITLRSGNGILRGKRQKPCRQARLEPAKPLAKATVVRCTLP